MGIAVPITVRISAWALPVANSLACVRKTWCRSVEPASALGNNLHSRTGPALWLTPPANLTSLNVLSTHASLSSGSATRNRTAVMVLTRLVYLLEIILWKLEVLILRVGSCTVKRLSLEMLYKPSGDQSAVDFLSFSYGSCFRGYGDGVKPGRAELNTTDLIFIACSFKILDLLSVKKSNYPSNCFNLQYYPLAPEPVKLR